MRRIAKWAPWLLCGAFAGCHLISGLDGVAPNESGNTPATPASSTTGGGDNSGAGGPGGAIVGGGGAGGDGSGGGECAGPADCPGDDTTCGFRTCESGTCGTDVADKGTACTEDGGELCDGLGHCVPGGCVDRTKNGDESDIDCGGPECLPCGEGSDCLAATDCETLFCDEGSCQKCGVDADCDDSVDHFCNVLGFCKPQKPLGSPCNTPGACLSGFCFDMVCCDSDCSGNCDTCNGGGGECKPIGGGQLGDPSCTPYLCDGASGDCPTSCVDDGHCVVTGYCDDASVCQPTKKDVGESCGAINECVTNYCVDDICCSAFECADACMACNVAGFEGDCTAIPDCP